MSKIIVLTSGSEIKTNAVKRVLPGAKIVNWKTAGVGLPEQPINTESNS